MTATTSGTAVRTGTPRQQLSEDVAAYVRELVISGTVRPGDFLRTEPIAAAVGVSNTPVREGLLILAGEGFVELVPRRGFVVSAFSSQDVRDLLWAQAMFAGELARRAAGEISPADLQRLRDLDAEQRAAVERGDTEATIRCGHEFHRTVNLASGSHRMTMMLGAIVRQLPDRFYLEIEGHSDDTLDSHPRIIAALAEGDGDEAARLMTMHIMSGADDLVTALAQQGLWDGES